MKKLTSFGLVHAIASHEKKNGKYVIKVSDVFHLSGELRSMHVTCQLGAGSFLALAEKYPKEVTVEKQEVHLRNLNALKSHLDRQMQFVKDDALYNLVWNAWQKK